MSLFLGNLDKTKSGTMRDQININKKFILGITLVSAIDGLLFGYGWVVIGGAKPFYERFFAITTSPYLRGWAMSSALIGCLFGAMFSGWFSDRYGRKLRLIVAAAMFTIAAIGAAMAVASTALWIACFVLTYTFPILNKLLNASGTFWLYGFICLSGFLFIMKKLPETKGKSLEEIESRK